MEARIPFTGFYETHHMDRIYDRIAWHYFGKDDEELEEDESSAIYGIVNWKAWKSEYAEEYCRQFAHYLGIKLEYKLMQSPREYNFKTDTIYAEISLADVEALRKATPDDKLREYIAENFTSYDGFSSFYSNKLEDWDAKPLSEWDHNETEALLNLAFHRKCEENGDNPKEMEYYLGE